jgi:D-alanyl-D-alanine carboxypeptidase (penicillin-binding protein 5/6)
MKNKLKTIIITLFVSIISTQIKAIETNNLKKSVQELKKDTSSFLIKDLKTNKILFSKEINKKIKPASLTKILTTIIALEEKTSSNEIVTITKEMVNVKPTIVGLKVGEKYYLIDLIQAMMIKSANDAANSVALYLGDDNLKTFLKKMNKKAIQIGMKDSNFENPCGFDSNMHYTTAKDLLKLSEYALKNNEFKNIIKKTSFSFKEITTGKTINILTSNKLQREVEYSKGMKTGFTNQAGACLISYSKENNKEYLLIMLKAKNRWKNAKQILDCYFLTNINHKSNS